VKKLKVLTVVGTRPEIIRLSSVIARLEEEKTIEHVLVHTGQNYDYELNEIFFRDFNLKKPGYFLNAAGATTMETIGNIIARIDPVLSEVTPDAFLILGDTNSCLSAIAAKRRHIPVFHMEAGNRCFDERVPEETNRKIADHIADINLTYSNIAREYLLREGMPPDRVIKTGSPMLEVINSQMEGIRKSDVVQRLNLNMKNYFVVSVHREENIDSDLNLSNLVDSLNAVAQKYSIPLIISTHPRTRKKLREKKMGFDSLVKMINPLGYNDYVKLQMDARAVLSDSGTISEEASILGLKALNIRQTHERPEAMEEAAVMMVGLKKARILQGLDILSEQKKEAVRRVRDYDVPNVSEKVQRIIISYTDYVNSVVWRVL
jgi:UDP-N-acetyl-L-fucosamine synthase